MTTATSGFVGNKYYIFCVEWKSARVFVTMGRRFCYNNYSWNESMKVDLRAMLSDLREISRNCCENKEVCLKSITLSRIISLYVTAGLRICRFSEFLNVSFFYIVFHYFWVLYKIMKRYIFSFVDIVACPRIMYFFNFAKILYIKKKSVQSWFLGNIWYLIEDQFCTV